MYMLHPEVCSSIQFYTTEAVWRWAESGCASTGLYMVYGDQGPRGAGPNIPSLTPLQMGRLPTSQSEQLGLGQREDQYAQSYTRDGATLPRGQAHDGGGRGSRPMEPRRLAPDFSGTMSPDTPGTIVPSQGGPQRGQLQPQANDMASDMLAHLRQMHEAQQQVNQSILASQAQTQAILETLAASQAQMVQAVLAARPPAPAQAPSMPHELHEQTTNRRVA